MMRILLLLSLIVWGNCAFSQEKFTLTITLEKSPCPGDKLFLFYWDTDSSLRVDSAEYKDNRFELQGCTPYPQRAAMIINAGGQGVPVLYSDEGATFVFLEKGHIAVSAGNELQEKTKRKGTSSNDDLQDFQDHVRFFDEWLTDYRQRFREAYRNRDSKTLSDLNSEYTCWDNKRQKAEKEWFDHHPHSLVSLDWLARSFNLPREKSKVTALFKNLDKQVKNSIAGHQFKQLLRSVASVEIGQLAPDFTAENIRGEKIALSGFRGRYVLLDFWASWCGPCRRENANVLKVYNRFKGKRFTILGYSVDSSEQAWKNAVRKDSLPWEQLSGLNREKGEAVDKLYGVKAIPSNFLISPEGEILAIDLRGEELEKQLEHIFQLTE